MKNPNQGNQSRHRRRYPNKKYIDAQSHNGAGFKTLLRFYVQMQKYRTGEILSAVKLLLTGRGSPHTCLRNGNWKLFFSDAQKLNENQPVAADILRWGEGHKKNPSGNPEG